MRELFLMVGAVAALNGMGVFLLGLITWRAGRLHELLSGAIERHDDREDVRSRALDDTHNKVIAKGQKALDEEGQYREALCDRLKAIHHATEEIVEQLAALAPHEPLAQVAAPLPELPVLDAPRPAEPAADEAEGEDGDNAKTVVMNRPQMAALLAATTEDQSRTTPAEPAVMRASSRPAPPPTARPSQPTLAGIAPPSSHPAMRPPAPPFAPSQGYPLEYPGMPVTGASGDG